MNDLHDLVYRYYLEHFDELPFDKQFHFASRLFLWNQDDFGRTQIPRLRAEFTAHDNPHKALQQIFDEAQGSPVHGSKNAAELRRPYFEKYPQLKTQVLLLFRTAFMKHMYGIDAHDDLLSILSVEDFDVTMGKLLNDHETLSILSTHAVNLLYLYTRVVREDEKLFDPSLFLEIGRKAYDRANPIHIQLLIYLYTHCIIGEAKFYYRAVPELYADVYQEMLAELETILAEHFQEINLDNKFEYLVCCKLLGMQSGHEQAIFSEAVASLSDNGSFLIDRHNKNPQSANTALDTSEHRNVLFLMANRDFTPLGS